jgi:hypothetical protein
VPFSCGSWIDSLVTEKMTHETRSLPLPVLTRYQRELCRVGNEQVNNLRYRRSRERHALACLHVSMLEEHQPD